MNARQTPAADYAQLNAALAGFGLQRRGPAELIGAGNLNRNFSVHTQLGRRLLRGIRADQSDAAIANEHAAIAWAGARGIPVALSQRRQREPATQRAGTSVSDAPDTCVTLPDGSRWALFPFIAGHLPVRGALAAGAVAALGDMHGRLHATLAAHPQSAGATFTMQWSRASSIAALANVEDAARTARAAPKVIDAIVLQHALLLREPLRYPADFAHLPCQMLHGDFHDAQVLLDTNDRIMAVLDWELFQPGARIWELVRALAFMELLDQPLLTTYLRAYWRHVQPDARECAAGMALWWQSRLGGTWVWSAYFLDGNTRVQQVFSNTIATLHKLAEPGWRDAVTQRFCAAAAALRHS